MRKPWWLAVPVLLAILFHQTFFSFVDDDILYFIRTTQAACSMRLLQRDNCDRAREHLRRSFAEIEENKSRYTRMGLVLNPYYPLLSFVYAPFNLVFPRWQGAHSQDGLRYYQIYGWLYLYGWWLGLYCVALGLVVSAAGGNWLRGLVVLNGSLMLMGALDLFRMLQYFTTIAPRAIVMMLVVAALLRRRMLEETACRSNRFDIPFWGVLLLAALVHVRLFEIILPPLFAVIVLRLGMTQSLWKRALRAGMGLAVLVLIGEIAMHWMSGEIRALELSRDWRGLSVDAPLLSLGSFVTGIRENLRLLNDKQHLLYVLVFSIALWIVCRARITAKVPWTRVETMAVIAVAAWPGLVSFYDAGVYARDLFPRAFLGVGLFAVLATALADSTLMPWASWGDDTDAGVARIKIEGALQGLCVGLVALWLIGFASQVKHALGSSPWDMASFFLERPVEGPLLRYVQLALGLP